jgi:hypothetical protein
VVKLAGFGNQLAHNILWVKKHFGNAVTITLLKEECNASQSSLDAAEPG